MSLITLRDAHLAYGERPLLDGAQLTVLSGERLGLIGRNGTGKSTLLGILAGAVVQDAGELQRREGLRLVLVEQEPQLPAADSLRASLELRARPRAAGSGAPAPALPGDEREHWRREARLEEYLHRFGLSGAAVPAHCSGGERKRAALALALAQQPELLLLDEPTNHLDIEAIERLEELLLRVPAAIVITHDRAFLDRVATRIVELDRGVLRSYPGNFAAYEARKESELAAEELSRRRFEKFWQQEEVWIRRGVEARRTRNEGRVRRLERLRQERAERRDRLGSMRLTLNAGERSGELVAELEGVSKHFGSRAVIEKLSLRLMRGDRLGLIGPNGAGKSTLIRLILGELAPDCGRVRLGTRLSVAYFDQLRTQLDQDWTLAEAISPGSDWVQPGAERMHIVSYLGEFLFPAQRAQSPVRMLSGGERNRLLLARLFSRPANVIVLDEPTNDLDIDSLELLEQRLQEYAGTLLLVSHDRRFLDNVVTQTVAAEGNGLWREYVGGYGDYLRQRPPPAAAPAGRAPRTAAAAAAPPRSPTRMSEAAYHRAGPEQLRADRSRLQELEALLVRKYERWQALEEERARLA